MTEKYLNLENGKIIEVEIFKGKMEKQFMKLGEKLFQMKNIRKFLRISLKLI